MYRHVLVPLDTSEVAEAVLPHVTELASSGCLGRITFLTVVGIPVPWDPSVVGIAYDATDAQERVASEYLGEVEERFRSLSVPLGSAVIEAPDAAQTIVDYAKDQSIDLIVMGTHGYTGITKVILGSVAERVLKDAPCPILFVKARR